MEMPPFDRWRFTLPFWEWRMTPQGFKKGLDGEDGMGHKDEDSAGVPPAPDEPNVICL